MMWRKILAICVCSALTLLVISELLSVRRHDLAEIDYNKCLASTSGYYEARQHCANVTGHTPEPFWLDGQKIQIIPEEK